MKHEIDNDECSGIYKLKCFCGSSYVGRTTLKCKQQFKELNNIEIFPIIVILEFENACLYRT